MNPSAVCHSGDPGEGPHLLSDLYRYTFFSFTFMVLKSNVHSCQIDYIYLVDQYMTSLINQVIDHQVRPEDRRDKVPRD